MTILQAQGALAPSASRREEDGMRCGATLPGSAGYAPDGMGTLHCVLKLAHAGQCRIAEAQAPAGRPAGWWRARTRAQLQVEFCCLAECTRLYFVAASLKLGDCLSCSGSATQHSLGCPLGDDLTCEQVAVEIEGLL